MVNNKDPDVRQQAILSLFSNITSKRAEWDRFKLPAILKDWLALDVTKTKAKQLLHSFHINNALVSITTYNFLATGS